MCKADFEMKRTVTYDYLFNYFGGDMYDGRIVTGASVTLAIRCYKDGIEAKFDAVEPYVQVSAKHKIYLCDLFDVCFDRKKLFTVKRNIPQIVAVEHICGYDKIGYDIVGYSLDVAGDFASEPVAVAENTFRDFISSHIDDFDISDNKVAQCPSVGFIE